MKFNRVESMKKGQITIFIIIGVLLLSGFGAYSYLRQGEAEKVRDSENIPVISIKNSVESCLSEVGVDAILHNSVRGGYFEPVQNSLNISGIFIPLYLDSGVLTVPDTNTLQNEISKYVDKNLDSCISNFSYFKEKFGIAFEEGKPATKTLMTEKEVVLNLNYPVRISKAGETINLDRFSTTIKLPFAKNSGIVSRIIAEQKKSIDELPLGFISTISAKEGFLYQATYLSANEILVTLSFKEDSPEWVYAFILKYDWSQLNETEEE